MTAGGAERARGGLPGGGLDLDKREHRDVAEADGPLRTVHEQHDSSDFGASGLHEVDRLLDAPALRDDVLGDDIALALLELAPSKDTLRITKITLH